MELGTFGYDMDGNANMASVLQVKKNIIFIHIPTLMQNQLILTLLIYNF